MRLDVSAFGCSGRGLHSWNPRWGPLGRSTLLVPQVLLLMCFPPTSWFHLLTWAFLRQWVRFGGTNTVGVQGTALQPDGPGSKS